MKYRDLIGMDNSKCANDALINEINAAVGRAIGDRWPNSHPFDMDLICFPKGADQDVAAETARRLVTPAAWQTFDPERGSPVMFAYGVLRRVIQERRRSVSRLQRTREEPERSACQPAATLERQEWTGALEYFVRKLSAKDQLVIRRKFWGLPDETKWSQADRCRLCRALGRLRRLILG